MAEKRKFLICYDIVDEKRLRKVHNVFSTLAMSVQYSVFEAELSNVQLEQLKEKLQPYLKSDADKLTIYRLFKANAKIDLAIAADDEVLFF